MANDIRSFRDALIADLRKSAGDARDYAGNTGSFTSYWTGVADAYRTVWETVIPTVEHSLSEEHLDLLAIMNRICHHQVAEYAHPLTCGNDSRHSPLFPIVLGGRVVLRCADCSYLQTYLPGGFVNPS